MAIKKPLLFIFLISALFFWLYTFFVSYAFIFFVKDHQVIKLALKKNVFATEQKEFLVEVVNTRESTAKGLSLRKDLLSADGREIDALLFVFPKKEIRQFWMKEMLFAIDICWLNDFNFLSCEREVLPPLANEKLATLNSKEISNIVLETKLNKLSDEDLKSKLFFKWW